MNKIEELKEYVIEKNLGECLSSEWINCKTKYEWKCQKGHVFKKLWAAIKYSGEWCKQCTKVGIDACRDFASKHNGTLLSTVYKDNRSKLEWKCENNHIFQSSWRHIHSRQKFCPKCPQNKCIKKSIKKSKTNEKKILNKKLSIDDCHNEARKLDGECLEKVYVNRRTLMKWKCKNNHVFSLTLGAVRNNKRWCGACHIDSQRHDISVAQNIAKKYGGECLSTEYVNLETPMKWKCKEGHVWEVNMSNIKGSGSWCRMCHMRTRRDKSISKVYTYVNSLGGKIITDKKDIPYDIQADMITVELECKELHKWTTTFKTIQRGSWCPECTFKSETTCRYIMENIYPYKFPKKRLECMEYLELDGYCDELGLAFEYDGKQHITFIPYFHRNGEKDFEKQKERDNRKNKLCDKNGIMLLRIPHVYGYNDPEKLEKFIFDELEKMGL